MLLCWCKTVTVYYFLNRNYFCTNVIYSQIKKLILKERFKILDNVCITSIFYNENKKTKNTCKPTLIFFVSAACGKIACTCGTADDDTVPPSGPTA